MTAPTTPTLSEGFAGLLDTLGLAEYRPDGVGGAVFLHGLPREPHTAVAVTLVQGPPADARNGYDEPGVEYRTRGEPGDAVGPERAAQTIWDALHGVRGVVLPGGARLTRCYAAQAGPVYLGRDEQGRDEWSVMLATEVRRPTPNRR